MICTAPKPFGLGAFACYNDTMATSQNGYTVISREDCKFHDDIVDGLSLPLRPDDCGYVLARFAKQFNRFVEPLGRTETFGHSERKISGSDDWSNHASGTALDLNASQHPYGKEYTFTAVELLELRNLLGRFDGVVKWGGDYRVTKDEMHFEIDRPYDDVKTLAAVLRKNNTLSLDKLKPGKTNIEVYMVKNELSKRNMYDGTLNKHYGQDLVDAYKGWQRNLGFREGNVDGIPEARSLEELGFKVKEAQ